MAVAHKLKWRKFVNELRYMYEELDLIDEISAAAAPDFQAYYEGFCRQHNLDIGELNKQNADRLANIYGKKKDTDHPDFGALPYSGSTDLVPWEGELPVEEFEETHTDYESEDYLMHEIFSKLFKKLALQLHPDKLTHTNLTAAEKKEKAEMFTKAKEALEEKRYFWLLDYAEKLKVPLPRNYKQQTKWMKKEIERVRAQSTQKSRSFNYMFSECDTDIQRDNVIKQFVWHLFRIKIIEDNKEMIF